MRNKINPAVMHALSFACSSYILSSFLRYSRVLCCSFHSVCMSYILIHSAMCCAVYCALCISRHVCVNNIYHNIRPIHRYIVLVLDDEMLNTLDSIACMNEQEYRLIHIYMQSTREWERAIKTESETAIRQNKHSASIVLFWQPASNAMA